MLRALQPLGPADRPRRGVAVGEDACYRLAPITFSPKPLALQRAEIISWCCPHRRPPSVLCAARATPEVSFIMVFFSSSYCDQKTELNALREHIPLPRGLRSPTNAMKLAVLLCTWLALHNDTTCPVAQHKNVPV